MIVIEQKLANPIQYGNEIEDGSLYKMYESLKQKVEEKELQWLDLQEE